MTPGEMAELMAANHAGGLGWTETGLTALLEQPSVFSICRSEGFALVRVLGPEAEVLTVEVCADARGHGVGTWLLAQVMDAVRTRAVEELHLEVARDNTPALRLYTRAGFEIVGERRAYYRTEGGGSVDALLMRRAVEPPDAGDARPMGSGKT